MTRVKCVASLKICHVGVRQNTSLVLMLSTCTAMAYCHATQADPSLSLLAAFRAAVGLLLGTEAPVMTPNNEQQRMNNNEDIVAS